MPFPIFQAGALEWWMTFNIIIQKYKINNAYMTPTLSTGTTLCQGNNSECWDVALNSRELGNTLKSMLTQIIQLVSKSIY